MIYLREDDIHESRFRSRYDEKVCLAKIHQEIAVILVDNDQGRTIFFYFKNKQRVIDNYINSSSGNIKIKFITSVKQTAQDMHFINLYIRYVHKKSKGGVRLASYLRLLPPPVNTKKFGKSVTAGVIRPIYNPEGVFTMKLGVKNRLSREGITIQCINEAKLSKIIKSEEILFGRLLGQRKVSSEAVRHASFENKNSEEESDAYLFPGKHRASLDAARHASFENKEPEEESDAYLSPVTCENAVSYANYSFSYNNEICLSRIYNKPALILINSTEERSTFIYLEENHIDYILNFVNANDSIVLKIIGYIDLESRNNPNTKKYRTLIKKYIETIIKVTKRWSATYIQIKAVRDRVTGEILDKPILNVKGQLLYKYKTDQNNIICINKKVLNLLIKDKLKLLIRDKLVTVSNNLYHQTEIYDDPSRRRAYSTIEMPVRFGSFSGNNSYLDEEDEKSPLLGDISRSRSHSTIEIPVRFRSFSENNSYLDEEDEKSPFLEDISRSRNSLRSPRVDIRVHRDSEEDKELLSSLNNRRRKTYGSLEIYDENYLSDDEEFSLSDDVNLSIDDDSEDNERNCCDRCIIL